MALNFRAHKLQLTWRKWGGGYKLRKRECWHLLLVNQRRMKSTQIYVLTWWGSSHNGCVDGTRSWRSSTWHPHGLNVYCEEHSVISVSQPTKQINGLIHSIYWHICQQSTSSTMGKCHVENGEDKDRWNLYTLLSQFKTNKRRCFVAIVTEILGFVYDC